MARIVIDRPAQGLTAALAEYEGLETGDILYFPQTPFPISQDDRDFLLAQKQAGGALHKNISYRPMTDRLKGAEAGEPEQWNRMHNIMREYSSKAIAFVAEFLPKYASAWKLDFASFRPIEEAGRKLSHHARNDLIHVDAFGSRPSHGNRLLRIFTNINPERPRVWVTSDSFNELAREHAARAGLPNPPKLGDRFRSGALGALARLGLPVVNRPEYDRFMRRFHHYMKDNAEFQASCRKETWEFAPGSSWMVFTDTASHACLRGQFMLEQTFIVNKKSLAFPDRSPLATLERMAGFPLLPRASA